MYKDISQGSRNFLSFREMLVKLSTIQLASTEPPEMDWESWKGNAMGLLGYELRVTQPNGKRAVPESSQTYSAN